jgi:hypothetical protein
MSLSQREEIVRCCDHHEQAHRREIGFRRCVIFESYFIKYDSHASLSREAATLQYFYNMAANDSHAPRIPKVVDFFVPKEQMGYMVVERVETTAPTEDDYGAIAGALQWLSRVAAPPDLTIGSMGGGRARHPLFKNYEAPMNFSTKQALQFYMNLVSVCGYSVLIDQ